MKKHFIGNTRDLEKELDRQLEKWFTAIDVKFICCLWSNCVDEVDLFLITYEKLCQKE
jgi:hypothetical protein